MSKFSLMEDNQTLPFLPFISRLAKVHRCQATVLLSYVSEQNYTRLMYVKVFKLYTVLEFHK